MLLNGLNAFLRKPWAKTSFYIQPDGENNHETRYHTVFLIVFLPIETSHAEDTHILTIQTGNITVQLTGFKNDQGTVKLCACRSEDEYTGKMKEFCTAATELKNKKAEWVFKNMPYGKYSIKAFHDENENSKLDTNFVGMPR